METDPRPGTSRGGLRRERWQPIAGAAVIAACVVGAYSRTLCVPFLFDDNPSIENNASLRHLGTAFFPAAGTTVSGRPVLNLSLAANFALGGTDVAGYHLANLAIHILAAWALYGILRRALAPLGPLAALCGALLWALHPLQTEAVTYTVQRAESLMGAFYLLTLYGYVRGAEAAPDRGRPWFLAAWCFCLLGMGTKEVMVGAPLVAFLYDRTFLAGSFAQAWRRRRGVLLGLASTWIVLPLLVLPTHGKGGTAGFGQGVSAVGYLLTQLPAVAHYLRLCLWPSPLVFDYGAGLAPPAPGLVAGALIVAGLAAATAWALARRPAAGFLGAFFLITLAPSSSIVPVVTQTMAEHRMYLPSAAVCVLAVAALFAWSARAAPLLCLGLAACLGVATVDRNEVYRSEEGLWKDTASKAPGNERAHNNLGVAYLREAGRLGDAVREFREALRLNPGYVEARNNLGFALEMVPGQLPLAVAQFEEALRRDPDFPDAHFNLGNALDSLGRTQEAVGEYRLALRLRPEFVAAHCNLAISLGTLGRTQEAVGEYRLALRLRPDDPIVLYDLALELTKLPGGSGEALGLLREVVRLQPGNEAAQQALRTLGQRTGP